MPYRAAHTPARPMGNIGTRNPNGAQTTVAIAMRRQTPNIARNWRCTARGADPWRKNRFATATLSPSALRAAAEHERVHECADRDEEEHERHHHRHRLEGFDAGRRGHGGDDEHGIGQPPEADDAASRVGGGRYVTHVSIPMPARSPRAIGARRSTSRV